MLMRNFLLLAACGLTLASAHASQWTESCDKPGLTQTSTVCLVDSWGKSYWNKQTPAHQAEMEARAKRWGRRKAEVYCMKTRGFGSVPGPGSHEQDIREHKKGDVYVGVRLNPKCTEPKKSERVKESSSVTGSVARKLNEEQRKLNEQQEKKLKKLAADCKREPKSRACDELETLQEDQHTVAVGGNRG